MQRLIWQYICEQWTMDNERTIWWQISLHRKCTQIQIKSHYGCQSKNTQSQVILNTVKSYSCTCVLFSLNSLDLQINFESEQSLQTKQDSLLLRIDDLDQENRELKDQVSEIEEEKDRIEETLEKVQKNVKQYKQKLKDNQVQIDNTCIYNIWCLQV